MSFTYYRKYDTPKYGVTEQTDSRLALNPTKGDATQRDLTKSVVKRKRHAKEEKLDLCFEFTPTHPGGRRTETNDATAPSEDGSDVRKERGNLPSMKRMSSKFEHTATQTRKATRGEFVKENDNIAREKNSFDKKSRMLEINTTKEQEEEGEKERDISPRYELKELSFCPLSIGGGKKKITDSLGKSTDSKKRKLSSVAVFGEDGDLNTKKIYPCKNPEIGGDKKQSKYHHAEGGQSKQSLSPTKTIFSDSGVSHQGSSNYDLVKGGRASSALLEPSPVKDDRKSSRKNAASKSGDVHEKRTKSGSHPESSDLVKPGKTDRRRDIHRVEKKKLVRLEYLSMSYWDFVYSHRCERIILSLSSKKSEWDPSYSLTLQSVYDKFISRVRKEFYPPPVVEANPENEQLMQVKEKYIRIFELLEREKTELERSNAKLEEFVNKFYNSSHLNIKSNTVEGGSQSRCAKATEAHPDPETLLSDQERTLLTTKPDAGQIDLSAFVGIQTKIDAVELWSKQIGMINNSFELKTSAISSIMRKYKIPDSPSSLLRAFSLNY